ncbi:DUF1629 domain-containing protein [Xanthomonas axonopodis]|uniref:Immunity MXAN-0049 protein domain-containing protein n=1 Tax=Xanthomonas axonopodis pv. cajani TaxID=487827 RepID=A0ABX3MJB8_9XANT|nr:DUF1629 domain-containing protein [Xanthomonas axonopodis]OOX20894.1 hypothetical protein Xcaj_22085 [Xanthomonas axonopodis pv. cajani]
MTMKNKPKVGEFYVLSSDVRGGGLGHGVVFENEKELRPAGQGIIRPSSGGFPPLSEKPRLRYDKRQGRMPEDLQGGFSGYWLTSEPLKQILESVDPDGFAFVPCEFVMEDGSQGPPYFLCDVVRTLDALDEAASTLKILTEGYPAGKHYSLAGGASLAFIQDVVGTAHVFRTPYNSRLIVCDRVLRDALVESGFGKAPRSRGVWLEDAAKY